MQLNFGIGVFLCNGQNPSFYATQVGRLMNGYVESTGAVVQALACASNEALLPQFGQTYPWLPGKLGDEAG